MYAKQCQEVAQLSRPKATIIPNHLLSQPASVAGSGDFGEADYQAFQRNIQNRFRIRLSDYKSDQMVRRLKTLSEQRGHKSFASVFAKMQTDPELLASFLDTMTINVTEMLRNPERFAELSQFILPELLQQKKQTPLSVWSAGCSYGAEAYTMAMLVHEIEPNVAHRIRGTDIDQKILAKANAISFSEADMVNISPARRKAFFTDLGASSGGASNVLTARYQPIPGLRNRVQFGPHDLLADSYPSAEYHLILCRNVLIYFTDEAKERIYEGFFKALKPGGILFVGGTERLTDHRRIGFELIRPFFYRKPG